MKIIVVSEWKGEDDFKELRFSVESNINDINSFHYLILIDSSKKTEGLPQLSYVNYLSKRDFTFFGKLKSPVLRGILVNESKGVLVVAMEKGSALLKRTLKHSQLMSIGIEKETLPNFDMSFSDTQLLEGNLFKQINKYLTKIQL